MRPRQRRRDAERSNRATQMERAIKTKRKKDRTTEMVMKW